MEEDIIIGDRIRKIREDLKMSRETFSEMIDISDFFLGKIERGERSLSNNTLVKIVKFTGVSADYILFGNESSNNTVAKINRILNKCPDNVVEYIYNLIHATYYFIKNSKSKEESLYIEIFISKNHKYSIFMTDSSLELKIEVMYFTIFNQILYLIFSTLLE